METRMPKQSEVDGYERGAVNLQKKRIAARNRFKHRTALLLHLHISL